MNNDIFASGTKVQWIIYEGADREEAEEILASTKHLLRTSPIITQGPGVDFEVKLIDIVAELHNSSTTIEDTYTIIGRGEII